MTLLRIGTDASLTIAGTHYDTEANIGDTETIDDTTLVDDTTTIDEDGEVEILLKTLLDIDTTQVTTDNIRLDFRGNLVAQIVEDAGASKISVSSSKVITVKELIEGGI